jgi:hypothetical protein
MGAMAARPLRMVLLFMRDSHCCRSSISENRRFC